VTAEHAVARIVAHYRGRHATAHDYLEKIFQIPFWVRSLPENARTRIVQGLVEQSLKRSNKDPGYQDLDRRTLDSHSPRWNLEEQARPLSEDAPTELRPSALEIQEIELQCMETLGALLGQTPRAVKRFVNVYRLIKATASNRSTDFVSVDTEADFRSVLFLLGVVTGLTNISAMVFRALARGDADTIGALADTLHEASRPKGEPTTDHEARVLSDVTRLGAWVKDPKADTWRRLRVPRLNTWVRQVARFSYRIEHI